MDVTIRDLISQLESYAIDLGEDVKVRVALSQYHGAFAAKLSTAWYDPDLPYGDEATVLWLGADQVDSSESPYAPSAIFSEGSTL